MTAANRAALAALLFTACQSPPVDPGDTAGSTLTGDASSGGSTGDACPVGALGCACTDGGGCDPGLACEVGVCVDGCFPGSEGCTCADGGCFQGLMCEGGVCVDAVSPPCSEENNWTQCCGNGMIDDFEKCDEGLLDVYGKGNSDTGTCTTNCKPATCGDGFVGPGEACDDGNDVDADGCSACVPDTCGNGVVEASQGEECDPTQPDVECTAGCRDARKFIFVTSQMWKGGEIGGVVGGDEKCQALATEAGLPGEFKSWLATSKDDAPLVRFNLASIPYTNVAGDVIATSWKDLVQAVVDPVFLTETGSVPSPSEIYSPLFETNLCAWASNIDGPGGPKVDPISCGGWSSLEGKGAATSLVEQLSASFGADCSLLAPIICVEQ